MPEKDDVVFLVGGKRRAAFLTTQLYNTICIFKRVEPGFWVSYFPNIQSEGWFYPSSYKKLTKKELLEYKLTGKLTLPIS